MSIVVHKLPGGIFTEKRIKEVTLFFCQIFDKLIYKLLYSGTIRSHQLSEKEFLQLISMKKEVYSCTKEDISMDKNMRKRNELLAQTVIKGLKSRNMSGYYAADKEEAVKLAMELIPEGSSIAMGGCMSAQEIGLIQVLEDGNYNYIDRAKLAPREGLLAAYDADIFLSSANAITNDGIMVNIDGNANRVSCIAQGPKKVVFIVGMNKVCSDLDEAMKRARNVAAPANAQRFDIKTPCKETGKCFDCKSPDTICCQFLITRYSRHADRIHVILVNDTLGF